MTSLHKYGLAALVAGAALLPAAAFGIGPKGVWMLTDGDHQTDAIIQGGTVTTFAQDPNSVLQYPIEWNGTYNQWETVGRDMNQEGGVYTIDHTLIGAFDNFTSFTGEHLDGTLDTKDHFSYAVDYTTGDIIRYGDDKFNSPTTSIWNGGAVSVWCLTYDSVLDTLFVGMDDLIVQIDKSGNVLSRFETLGGGPVRSLGYDALDDTMWYLSYDGSTAFQTNAAGDNLSSMTVNLGGNYWGGEIAPVPASVPGPAALIPFAVGAISLLARRRRRA